MAKIQDFGSKYNVLAISNIIYCYRKWENSITQLKKVINILVWYTKVVMKEKIRGKTMTCNKLNKFNHF